MENTDYLKKNVNPFLIPLLKELMVKKPENSYEFIKDWVNKNATEYNIFHFQQLKKLLLYDEFT